MSRYLGVDYGEKRIGLAISDDLGMIARPLDVVSRDDLRDALSQIQEQHGIARVVVGLPTALGGHEGASAQAARQLGEEIAEILDVAVDYIDERFTSRMAESALLESGMKRAARRDTVDKVAAAIILQTYLDRGRAGGNFRGGEGVESPDIP